ncbi:hypothetical protein C8J57DRAFT_1234250 [Mycena rebaudengoi]|nr:hypothetical protein C8J57DRAFT_1234250 [Mycena rebaudengoi]
MHNLASKCQQHAHSKTCFKYWRGPPEPKSCRFDLHEENFKLTSSFDPETGELCLRCLDGLVNNFNSTILKAITKSQLKTHVAFAMLELAVKKLGEFNLLEDDLSELSAQQLSAAQDGNFFKPILESALMFADLTASEFSRFLFQQLFFDTQKRRKGAVSHDARPLAASPASPCAAQPPLRPAAMPSALSPHPHKCTPPTAANRPSRLRAAWRSSPTLPPPLSFRSAYSVLWTSLAARRAAVPRPRGCTAAARIFFTAQTRCPHIHRISEGACTAGSCAVFESAGVPSSTTNSRAASHPRGAGASIYTTLGAARALRTRRYVLTSRSLLPGRSQPDVRAALRAVRTRTAGLVLGH